ATAGEPLGVTDQGFVEPSNYRHRVRKTTTPGVATMYQGECGPGITLPRLTVWLHRPVAVRYRQVGHDVNARDTHAIFADCSASGFACLFFGRARHARSRTHTTPIN